MTDKNKALIVVILDRSGSMESIRKDMVGGFARFIKEQKDAPGECFVSLYQFDTQYDVVYENQPIAKVGELPLVPRGGTALLDAIGKTIVNVGEQLVKLPEDQRPGAVIVMIITDGAENSSSEWRKEQIAALVKQQHEQYKWQFMYLGADMNSINDAHSYGIASAAQYTPNTRGVGIMYSSSSNAVRSYRSAVQANVVGASLHIDPNLTADDEDEETETTNTTS